MSLSRREALDALRQRGWIVEEGGPAVFELPPPLRDRYPAPPPALAAFLGGLRVCANAGQTAWFLCADDFTGRDATQWHWNEFELMALGWAETGEQRAEVVAFWDGHFPFLVSAHTGYAFFAVSLRPEAAGQVVQVLLEYGVDEPSVVAACFDEFLSLLLAGQFTAEVGEGSTSAV